MVFNITKEGNSLNIDKFTDSTLVDNQGLSLNIPLWSYQVIANVGGVSLVDGGNLAFKANFGDIFINSVEATLDNLEVLLIDETLI